MRIHTDAMAQAMAGRVVITAVLIVLTVFSLGLLVGSLCLDAAENPVPQPWSLDKSKVSDQLKAFIAAKEAQANVLAAADGKQLLPEFKSLFVAAAQGDLRTMSNIWEAVRDHSTVYGYPDTANHTRSHAKQWQPALETYGALAEFADGEDKYPIAFGQDIIQSIPPGSIYFGGTGPGRFLVTALSRSQINADPFFTLTQNGLQDDTYLDYLRAMYGSRIAIPSEQDIQCSFQDYAEYLQLRAKHREQLNPDEGVTITTNGDLRVTGAGAVFNIRGRISKLIFDKNPDHEFYFEESFVNPWMYPYLEPHGLIMKLNRKPLAQLNPAVVARDRDFWDGLTKQLLTDPGFLGNRWARITYSKHRTAIAGVYAYRRLTDEAEYAFKQAVALDPKNPEANFRLVQLYAEQNRFDDGITVLKSLQQRVPSDQKLQGAISELERLKQSKQTEPSP